jgi:hypothetical protein
MWEKGISQQTKKEKKKKRTSSLQRRARLAERHSAWIQEKGGPPSERGSQYTCDGKGAVSGERKEKRKRRTRRVSGRWQGRRHARGFESKGAPLAFASEREPLWNCERVRKKKKKEKDEPSGRGATHADSRKRGPPFVFVSERGPVCLSEKGSSQQKTKNKK